MLQSGHLFKNCFELINISKILVSVACHQFHLKLLPHLIYLVLSKHIVFRILFDEFLLLEWLKGRKEEEVSKEGMERRGGERERS